MKAVQQYLPDVGFHRPDPRTIRGQTVTVPSLYGLSTQAAAAALRQAGFSPVVGPTVDSANTAGTVAYLSPGSGSQAPTGTTVTIYVSDGTPYVAPRPKAKAKKKGGKPTNDKPRKNRGKGKGRN
jgi:beta-lactam-binding protein with PASTA domain